MSGRAPLFVMLLVLTACGENPTAAVPGSAPVQWAASIEEAVASLDDPVVSEVIHGLADPALARRLQHLLREARSLATRDLGTAAHRLAESIEALGRHAAPEDLIHAAVLDLVLRDVEERFQQVLDASPISQNQDRLR